jgi:hypothetical protein
MAELVSKSFLNNSTASLNFGAAMVPRASWCFLRKSLIIIRFQDETNRGNVSAWQDHAGLIYSL